MKKILNYNLFLEANLNLIELDKERGGVKRGQVLVNKLKSGQEFHLPDDKEIKINSIKVGDEWLDIDKGISQITTDDKYDSEKAHRFFTKNRNYVPVFQDEKKNQYKLNQLKKTKDFGSKGPGVRVRKFESIQAIFLAIKQAFPEVELTPDNAISFFVAYTNKVKVAGEKLLYIPENIELNQDLIEDFAKDPDWMSTFCKIPNEIWDQEYHIDRKKLYVIYQVGIKEYSPLTVLRSKYRECSLNENFKEIDFSKWCPADIYMCDYQKVNEVMEKIQKTKTIDELTELLDDLFDEDIFIPISLKKVLLDKDILIITNREKEKNLPYFKIEQLYITDVDPDDPNGMKGIGSKALTKSSWRYRDEKLGAESAERIVSFDSSDSSKKQNIDGEVEGSASRHGKISWNAIKRFIEPERKFVPSLPVLSDASDLRRYNIEDLENKVIELTDQIKKQNIRKLVSIKPIRGQNIKGNEGKLISRIQSLEIIQALNELYNHNIFYAHRVMTKIMRYALSIKTDKFTSPRYLRVI